MAHETNQHVVCPAGQIANAASVVQSLHILVVTPADLMDAMQHAVHHPANCASSFSSNVLRHLIIQCAEAFAL